MDKGTRVIGLVCASVILVIAVSQWAVLLERTGAAVWAWYKFYGYGGDGYITVGATTQLIFYLISCLAAGGGFLVSRLLTNGIASQIQKRLSRICSLALAVGVLFWTVILMSPLVKFR